MKKPGKEKINRVMRYCIRVIRRRGRISTRELYEIARQRFPEYEFTSYWLGWHLTQAIKGTDIQKWYGNGLTYYGTAGQKRTKKCRICGREIPITGPDYCSPQCEKELERIVNFYIPPPAFSSSS